ncbi:MAG TPA: nuclear transport factor 2 family protein [Rudaea sp.]|nr:nuclear transport factor 2 family protein [Rudaea sp.]
MYKFLALAAIALLSMHAAAQEPRLHGNLGAARAIVKADGDFAAQAARDGTAKAFADWMDAVDGVIYGGGSNPSIGRDAIYRKMGGDAPDANVLAWHPLEVFAARAGDMGVSRGRWTSTPKAGGKSVGGSYVTVWRRNAKGEWKGLIDIGNADPAH